MSIRDNYKKEAAKPVPAAPATTGKTSTAPSTTAAGKPVGQSPEQRKALLGSIQAKLAARQQAGAAVNPPEASAQLTADKLEPMADEAAETEGDEDSESSAEPTGAVAPPATPGVPASKPRGRPRKSASTATSTATVDASRDWPAFFETVSTHELLAELFRRFR